MHVFSCSYLKSVVSHLTKVLVNVVVSHFEKETPDYSAWNRFRKAGKCGSWCRLVTKWNVKLVVL